jgi:hypothetical protein
MLSKGKKHGGSPRRDHPFARGPLSGGAWRVGILSAMEVIRRYARNSHSPLSTCARPSKSPSRSGLLMCVAVGVPTRQVRTFGSRRAAFPPCLRTAGGLSLVQRGADLRLFWMLCREGNSGWDIVLLVRSRGKEAPPSCSSTRGLNSRERARGAGLRIFAGRCRRWRGLLVRREVSLLTRDGRHPEANRGPSAARRQTSPTAEQLCRK